MQADCSVQATHSFEISGVWTAPASVLWVVGGKPDDFELKGIVLGTGPGSQVPSSYRASDFDADVVQHGKAANEPRF